MKPELSEQLFIEELFAKSLDEFKGQDIKLDNIDKLTGDASTRRYYRLFTNKDSFVACLDNPTEPGKNRDKGSSNLKGKDRWKGIKSDTLMT